MSEVNYTEQNPWILPSGRKLWRHPNGEGCVLEFNMYGKIVQLYVPDAEYRDFSFRTISSNIGWDTQLHTPVLKYNDYTYLFDSEKLYSQPFTPDEFLTDSQLQIKLDSILNNGTFANDFTAKEGTNAILESLDSLSEAATYARSLVPTGLSACDLPNIYELAIIWLESDNIDSIDPTVDNSVANTRLKLGNPDRFDTGHFLTCTEIQDILDDNNFKSADIYYNGIVNDDDRNASGNVLPVLELSIKSPKHKLITKVVVVDKGEAYETKGVSLGESEVLTTLTSLVQEYQTTYDELNQKVTALETKYNQGRVKIVESMMELKNNPEENLLYINDEVKAIVDDGSGIIPKAYISGGSEVTLKEIERKEEDPDDGNEYIGYVNKAEAV